MNGLHTEEMLLPDYLIAELQKDSIGSYNAGILGGSDIDFIQRYCEMALRIVKDNGLDLPDASRHSINYNLLIEQMLFYAMVKAEDRRVVTVFEQKINDNGYTYEAFCDFTNIDKTPLLHLLGGHKRNQNGCFLLEKTLLKNYPDVFWKTITMFRTKHTIASKKPIAIESGASEETITANYKQWLNSNIAAWKDIPFGELKTLEEQSSRSLAMIQADKEWKKSGVLVRNPYLCTYKVPSGCHIRERMQLLGKFRGNDIVFISDIACIPSVFVKGYEEVPINDLGFNILTLLREELTYEQLTKKLLSCFSDKITANGKHAEGNILKAIESLITAGLIYVKETRENSKKLYL